MLKKSWLLIGLSAFLLTACPSDTQQDADKTPTQQTGDEIASNQPTNINSPLPHPDSLTLSFEEVGKMVSVIAKPHRSEQVPYTIYLPAGFSLNAEEPGKDVVLSDLSEVSSMRLEVIIDHDANTEKHLVDAMRAGLVAGGQNEDIHPLNVKLPNTVEHATIEQTSTENMFTTGMVFKQDDIWVRATIFSDKNANLSNALVEIATTIRQNSKI